MSRSSVLSDSALRAALAPDADVVLPPGLLESISQAVRTTPQERAPLRVPGLDRLLGRTDVAVPGWLEANRGLVLVAATVALLLALLGGALLGVGRLEHDRAPLRPTGLVRITSESLFVDRVVPGRDGRLWALAAGQVMQFDPATGERQSWSAADDVAFAQPVVAPAAEGDLWILADGWARRFDGAGFVEAIPLGTANPMELVPASDGSLWLTSWDVGLQRWDGRAWRPAPPGRPTDAVDVPLLVLGPEDIWVENPGPAQRGEDGPYSLGISHLVGDTWVTYDSDDAPQLAGPIGAIERAADGSIWVTQDPGMGGARGIARFDGQTWTTIEGPPTPAWWLEADPDGSMWAITSAADGSATVARWTDGTWREFGRADGIRSRSLGAVSVTPAGTFLGSADGLLRYSEGRWEPALPDGGPAEGPATTATFLADVIAISEREAWATDGTAVWHWVDGGWTRRDDVPALAGGSVTDLALASDGSLWVATETAVVRLLDGRWAVAEEVGAQIIEAGQDGTAWATGIPFTASTQARAGIPASTVRHLVPDGAGFEVRRVDCPLSPAAMAIAGDGTVYLGDIGYSSVTPGLARVEGRSCEMVDLRTAGGPPAVTAVVPDPRGGVVVEALATLPEAPGGDPWHGYLLHVDGAEVSVITDLGEVDGSNRPQYVDGVGRVWLSRVVSKPGIEAVDGTRRARLLDGVDIAGPLSVAPDGSVFLIGFGGVYRWIPDEAAVTHP